MSKKAARKEMSTFNENENDKNVSMSFPDVENMMIFWFNFFK